jgi:flagellar biosynthesis anti-sigma factor FlgM
MNVNNIHQIINAHGLNGVKKAERHAGLKADRAYNAPNGGAAFAEGFSMSAAAKEFQAVRQAMAQTPDARHELVEEIKARIAAGNYSVPAGVLAEKMVNSGFFI